MFLWYPGNSVVLPGTVERFEEVTVAEQPHAALCFQYGAITYNPVTKQRGSKWNCFRQTCGLAHIPSTGRMAMYLV